MLGSVVDQYRSPNQTGSGCTLPQTDLEANVEAFEKDSSFHRNLVGFYIRFAGEGSAEEENCGKKRA